MKLVRNLIQGAAAGLLGGGVVGLVEASYLAIGGLPDLLAPVYALVLYGAIGLPLGLGCAVALTVAELAKKVEEPWAFALPLAGNVSALGLVILRYVLNRDVYMEQGVPLSGMAGIALVLLLVDALILFGLRRALEGALAPLLRAKGVALAFGVPLLLTAVLAALPLSDDPRAGWAHPPTEAGLHDKPNVLVIMVDTLRADHTGGYSGPELETPAMDQLAADGVVFEQAYAAASWTRSSGASLMTSMLPSGHNADLKSSTLSDEAVTFAEVMQAGGMRTGALINNINLTASFNFDQGWDSFIYEAPAYRFGASESVFGLSMYKVVHKLAEKLAGKHKEVDRFYQPAEVVLDDARGFIEANASSRWGLFVHLMEPHDPYFEHPYLDGSGDGEFNGVGYSRAEDANPPADMADTFRAVYADEVEHMDARLVEFFGWMRESGRYDDTLIVLTADHGEEFMEHGGWWHGTTLYDEQIHVPLVVKLPGGRLAGERAAWQVRSIDIAPTLVAAVGMEADESWQGVDLFRAQDWVAPVKVEVEEPAEAEESPPVVDPTRACLEARAHAKDRLVVAEEDFEGNQLAAVRSKGFKRLVANADNPRGLPEQQLFDVASDSGEMTDLHGSGANTCGTYHSDWAAELDEALNDAIDRAVAGAVQGGTAEVDAAECERLLALGYVESCP